MILSKIRNNNAPLTFGIIILLVIVRFMQAEVDFFSNESFSGPLWYWLKDIINPIHAYFNKVIALSIFLIAAIGVTIVLNQNKIFNRHNYLLWMLSFGCLSKVLVLELNAHILVLLLIPLIYYQLIEIARSELLPYANVFNLGLIMGLGAIFQLHFIISILLLLVYILLVLKVNLRIVLLYLAGTLVSIYICLMLNYLLGFSASLTAYWDLEVVNEHISSWTLFELVFYGVMMLSLIAAAIKLQGLYSRLIVLKRKFHSANYLLFLSGVLSILFAQEWNVIGLTFIAIPACVLMTDWLNRMEKIWVYELICLILLSSIIL